MGEKIGIETRVKRRGDLLNKEQVKKYIDFLLLTHPDISKIIVCVDSECTPEKEMEKTTNNIEVELKPRIKRPIYFANIVHALEGWLLADQDNIRKYLGSRVSIHIPPSAPLECKPKEVIKAIFRKAGGKKFLYTRDNPKIAENLDVKKAAKCNKSFANFLQIVKDP